jgi:SAM-dependent methyltransferase
VDWPWEIVERDHELQNPTSAQKIVLLGDYLRLDSESRVLDIACGKGGPALILASTFGCRILGIEVREGFAGEARARVAAAGLESLVEVQTADAASVELEPGAWDVALCLGAAFVWGTIADAAAALHPAVRGGGSVAIGEPFWRQLPPSVGAHEGDFVSLAETVARFEGAGVATTGIIAGSEDDWDRHHSLHWRAIEEWLVEEPDHPDAAEVRAQHEERRARYFRVDRAALGWAIFSGLRR